MLKHKRLIGTTGQYSSQGFWNDGKSLTQLSTQIIENPELLELVVEGASAPGSRNSDCGYYLRATPAVHPQFLFNFGQHRLVFAVWNFPMATFGVLVTDCLLVLGTFIYMGRVPRYFL